MQKLPGRPRQACPTPGGPLVGAGRSAGTEQSSTKAPAWRNLLTFEPTPKEPQTPVSLNCRHPSLRPDTRGVTVVTQSEPHLAESRPIREGVFYLEGKGTSSLEHETPLGLDPDTPGGLKSQKRGVGEKAKRVLGELGTRSRGSYYIQALSSVSVPAGCPLHPQPRLLSHTPTPCTPPGAAFTQTVSMAQTLSPITKRCHLSLTLE